MANKEGYDCMEAGETNPYLHIPPALSPADRVDQPRLRNNEASIAFLNAEVGLR